MEEASTQINSINDFSSFLENVSSTNSANDLIIRQTKMQLAVISSVNSLQLASYSINNILELLKGGLCIAQNEQEKHFYQVEAANMVQTIFLFANARISILQNKNTESTFKLLDEGTTFLQKSVVSLTSNLSGIVSGQKITAFFNGENFKKNVFNAIMKSIVENPLSKAVKEKITIKKALKESKLQLAKLEEDFYKKGVEYRGLFGDSIVFKEILKTTHHVEPIKKQKINHPVASIFFTLSFLAFVFMTKKSLPQCNVVFLVLFILTVCLEIFLFIYPVVMYKKVQKLQKEELNDFNSLLDGQISSEIYKARKEELVLNTVKYLNLKNIYEILAAVCIAFMIFLPGTGLFIILWTIQTNGFLTFLCKFGAILIAIIVVVFEIVYGVTKRVSMKVKKTVNGLMANRKTKK